MDASERASGADSGRDDRRDQGERHDARDGVVVGRWPDGAQITEAECRAPDDLRELTPELRRFLREHRWTRRREKLAGLGRLLGSPRAAIAIVLLAALVASAVAMLLPAAR
ncbi:MAG: hypothetical protein ACRDLV_15690 [Solirubrobacteraceae bacterium]